MNIQLVWARSANIWPRALFPHIIEIIILSNISVTFPRTLILQNAVRFLKKQRVHVKTVALFRINVYINYIKWANPAVTIYRHRAIP